MRKISVFNRVSLDGFYASTDGNIDWFINDPEVDKALHEILSPDTTIWNFDSGNILLHYSNHQKE